MVVYQIHERGGSYEDAYDFIRATYLSKEKAEKEWKALVNAETDRNKLAEKCNKCPIYDYVMNKNTEKKILQYCSLFNYNNATEDCRNREERWDEVEFDLKTVEVIE